MYIAITCLCKASKLSSFLLVNITTIYWSSFPLGDCISIQDPDDTLKRKTFELLYKMTKSTNVEVIVDRMIDYMISINDNHYKTEIASRCVELAEQFAPSNQWFIQVGYYILSGLLVVIVLNVFFVLQFMSDGPLTFTLSDHE